MIIVPPSAGGDDRRHKTWCEHFRKSDGTCWCKDPENGYFGKKCPGSAHCSFYSPKEKASAPFQTGEHEVNDGKPVVRFTWKAFVGEPVVHSTFGAGTVTDANDRYLTVHFETAGTKLLSSAWCVQKGLIKIQDVDYPTLFATVMRDSSSTDEDSNDEEPIPPQFCREASLEPIADVRRFVKEPAYEEADTAHGLQAYPELRRGTLHADWVCTSPSSRSIGRMPLPQLKPPFKMQFLLKMTERGMTAVDCYTRANIDRKLFSKIFSSEMYKPRKETAIALIMTLSPTEREMDELLKALGYCLSESNLFDLVIEYCVRNRIYDLFDVNDYLYEMDLPLLGSCE